VTAASVEAAAMWLIYPTRSYVPLKVRVFVQVVRAAFRDDPPWDAPSAG